MSEYIQKRWKCDFCGRDVKRGVMPPAGWLEIKVDFYGNTIHCCPDRNCREAREISLDAKEYSQ